MFHFARANRSASPPALPLEEQPPVEPPAVAFIDIELLRPVATFGHVAALRVGDYEVGEVYCPRLCGHPGIRY